MFGIRHFDRFRALMFDSRLNVRFRTQCPVSDNFLSDIEHFCRFQVRRPQALVAVDRFGPELRSVGPI